MKLDPKKTAMLTLDLQKGILAMGAGYEAVIPIASKLTEFARKQGYLLIHVGLGFSEGYPEVPDSESVFSRAKQNGLFIKGSPSSEFHEAVIDPKDLIVYKQRIGAFSENELQLILRSKGIKNLVLFGVSTSGIVLATVTRAFDLDFKLTLIEDACFDLDAELHQSLIQKVFSKKGVVMTSQQFMEAQASVEVSQ